ncbi:MAG: response regulator [bacterium]|nr:response regulator [bacterium]
MKILTVDDSKIIRKIVSGVIEMTGYEPVGAANGLEALDVLREQHEDVALVVLDWNMPEMDGITCLKEIRADADLASIPVMMLTTESERERMASAIAAGANHYCAKPFTPEGLAVKIMECLGLGG